MANKKLGDFLSGHPLDREVRVENPKSRGVPGRWSAGTCRQGVLDFVVRAFLEPSQPLRFQLVVETSSCDTKGSGLCHLRWVQVVAFCFRQLDFPSGLDSLFWVWFILVATKKCGYALGQLWANAFSKREITQIVRPTNMAWGSVC